MSLIHSGKILTLLTSMIACKQCRDSNIFTCTDIIIAVQVTLKVTQTRVHECKQIFPQYDFPTDITSLDIIIPFGRSAHKHQKARPRTEGEFAESQSFNHIP